MKFRPPTHRVDAPIVFIHPADEAWDQDKIAESEKEHGEDCPYLRYVAGKTRYDASDVQHLLKGDPVEFHGKRLGVVQHNEVQSLADREGFQQAWTTRGAYMQAARYGLHAVKQGGVEVIDLGSPGSLTTVDLEKLRDCSDLGIELIRDIGRAFYIASQPLRDDEKKP